MPTTLHADPFAPPAESLRPRRLWISEPQLLLMAFVVSSAAGAGALAAGVLVLPLPMLPEFGPNVWAIGLGALVSAMVGALVPTPGAAVTIATLVGMRAFQLEGSSPDRASAQAFALAAATSLAGVAVFMGFVLGLVLTAIGIASI